MKIRHWLIVLLLLPACESGDRPDEGTVATAHDEAFELAGEPAGTNVRYLEAPGTAEQARSALMVVPPAVAAPVSPMPRMIVKTAGVDCEVEDYEESVAEVRRIADGAGGFVVSSTAHTQDGGMRAGEVVVRVPAGRFEEVLASLKALAVTVEAEYVRGNDITEEFYDLSARLDNKRKAEQRFLEILKAAKTSKEILEVEQALMGVREEIERMEGRKRFLEDQTALSTVTMRMHEPRPLIHSGTTTFWTRLQRGIGYGLERGMDGFVDILSGIITFVIAAIPFLVGVVVLVRGGRKLYRRTRPANDD